MKVIIDNQEYDTDTLTAETKAQLSSLQFVDSELVRLQGLTAIYQTARNAYAKALKESLPTAVSGDTIKFS